MARIAPTADSTREDWERVIGINLRGVALQSGGELRRRSRAHRGRRDDGAVIAQEPVGRMRKPEGIAAGVVWLCSEAAAFVIGHAMVVDGGANGLSRRAGDSGGSAGRDGFERRR
jgi:NAD(P)-dependent dehydrogenase (short-subunit alcohol dehydrogenase family)